MQVVGLAWGILAVIGFFVALLPCLGSLNWINIPFSSIGLILNIVALVTAKTPSKGKAIVGLILCAVAVLIGVIRLAAGGGVL
jgi:uncharacterized RDD family membrane protein YckC